MKDLFVYEWPCVFFHDTDGPILCLLGDWLFTVWFISTESPFAHVDKLSCAP